MWVIRNIPRLWQLKPNKVIVICLAYLPHITILTIGFLVGSHAVCEVCVFIKYSKSILFYGFSGIIHHSALDLNIHLAYEPPCSLIFFTLLCDAVMKS